MENNLSVDGSNIVLNNCNVKIRSPAAASSHEGITERVLKKNHWLIVQVNQYE